jgi:alginate O-acetyltransferase complex protein AlgI
MVFSSISFLYYFLPLMLISYALTPKAYKNGILCLGSLLFYSIGEPRYIFILIISILIDYFLSLRIETYRHTQKAKLALILSIVMNLSLLGFFKYINFFLSILTPILGIDSIRLPVSLPIGISFFTFQTMSYTIDIYRGRGKAQKNIIDMATYVTMFPQLIAGPIVRYQTVAEEINHRFVLADDFSEGIRRFLEGLAKKVLLANTMGELYLLLEKQSLSIASLWFMAIAFMLQIYFDFSGYSDMAIGLGRMFGFHFPENFNYPYIATSITDFWRRWHMSLGTWFRDYVYIPLGGNQRKPLRVLLNLLFVWFLTGLWHGAHWNYILWGLYFGCILIIEKLFKTHQKNKHLLQQNQSVATTRWISKTFSHLYVVLVVLFGFVLFKQESLTTLRHYVQEMVGLGTLPLITAQANYTITGFIPLLLLGILFSTPLPHHVKTRYFMPIKPTLSFIIGLSALLFITAFIVDASYNPFLYFRF